MRPAVDNPLREANTQISSLRSRIFLLIAPMVGLALLISQLLPHLSWNHQPLSLSQRQLWLIVLVVSLLWLLLWLLLWGPRRLSVHIRLKPPPPAIETEASPNFDEEERQLALLRTRFRFWRPRLRKASRQNLPRYLLLGNGGAGKTALANNLCKIQTSSDAGLCQLHFARNALLFEAEINLCTPGLQLLLQQLLRLNRRYPLHGVLIIANAQALLSDDNASRNTMARHLADTLGTIHEHLGIPVPASLYISHCDRLTGFESYFADLSKEQREQPWGIRLATDRPGQEDWQRQYPAFLQHLAGKLPERLQQLPDAQQRAESLTFLRHMSLLQRPLDELISQLAPAESPLGNICFTSSLQQGQACHIAATPLSGLLAPSSSVPHARQQHYFIGQLLATQLLPATSLLPARLPGWWRSRLWRGLAIGTFLLATLGLAWCYQTEHQRAIASLAAMQKLSSQMAQAVGNSFDPTNSSRLLDRLQQLPLPAVPAHDNGFWSAVHTRLADDLGRTYARLLGQLLAPALQWRLSQAMQDPHASIFPHFQALRLYLMLSNPLSLRPQALLAWLAQHPDPALAPAAAHALFAYNQQWLARPPSPVALPVDARLVANTRQALLQAPLAPALYDALQVELSGQLPGQLSLSSMAGDSAGLVLQRKSGLPLSQGVAARYTQQGYAHYQTLRNHLLADPAGWAWVLGNSTLTPQIAALRPALDNLYFQDYQHAWDALLNDVSIKPLSQLGLDGGGLRLLASPASPLRKLLLAASAQTSFTPINSVDLHFATLHDWTSPQPDSKGSATDSLQAALNEAAVYMDAVKQARDHNLPPPPPGGFNKLQTVILTHPGITSNMLGDILKNSSNTVNHENLASLNSAWQSQIGQFCHRALDGRYPFKPSSQQEVTLADFSTVFAPGGLIDRFGQKYLQGRIDQSQTPWQAVQGDGNNVPLSARAVQMLERASMIRSAFFPGTSQQPAFGFTLLPLSLDQQIQFASLNVGQQSLHYAHGPALPVTFSWPPNSNPVRVQLSFLPTGTENSQQWHSEGPWAWLHLIQHGQLQPMGSNQYNLALPLGKQTLLLQVTANSVNNAFQPGLLRGFSCSISL